MSLSVNEQLEQFKNGLVRRNPGLPEYHQAVMEVAGSIIPYIADKPQYHEYRILERMTEPDRIVTFRVCWEDDNGNIRVNRGYRVQQNNAIGPYKGGLRFHPTVTLSVLQFLAFEQVFKNSLTGLPMGGGKGGSDFNPKGKSDHEVMRFCQAFMTELVHYIGPNTDVPAGDIGVGQREIGFLFGQHKRLCHEFSGVLTGKGLEYGGSLIRTEATGYGAVYFLQDMMEERGESLEGRRVAISGSGNVAQYAAEKVIQLGGKVCTLSDSSGYVYSKSGITAEQLAWVVELKTQRRGRIKEAADEFNWSFIEGTRPWEVPVDFAIPCATQNEINAKEARTLVKNGCIAVSEGANMPSEQAAVDVFQEAGILFAPSKAANAGGVAVSGLEMSQNQAKMSWEESRLDEQLRDIMRGIHARCCEYGREPDGRINYLRGANVGGFIKVANAMLAYGVI